MIPNYERFLGQNERAGKAPAEQYDVLRGWDYWKDSSLQLTNGKDYMLRGYWTEPGKATDTAVAIAHSVSSDATIFMDATSRLLASDYVGKIADTVAHPFNQAQRMYRRGYMEDLRALFQQLDNDSKLDFVELNTPSAADLKRPLGLWHGRSHIKVAGGHRTDGRAIAYIGDVDPFDAASNRPGIMIPLYDEKAEALLGIGSQVNERRPKNHTVRTFEDGDSIIYSTGEGMSPIIARGVEDIMTHASPEYIIGTTSQVAPDGPFLRALAYAHKMGADVRVIAPRPDMVGSAILKILDIKNIQQGKGKIPISLYPDWVHTKSYVIVNKYSLESGNTEGIASVGSDNFTQEGDAEEMNFVSSNPTFVRNIFAYFNYLYAVSSPPNVA